MTAPHRMEDRISKSTAGESEALILPRGWNPAAQATNKPGVVAWHGRGNTFEQMVTAPFAERILYALADAGYPVLSIDAGGTATWGNDASQTAYQAAVARMQGAIGAATSGVVPLGYSMGGLGILDWLRGSGHAANTKCALTFMPVVDLVYSHDTEASYAAEQQTAYSLGAGNFAGNATITSHDPMQNTSTHAAGPPIGMWRASNDTVATTARQDAFATAVGAKVTKTDLGAVGHTGIGTVDPAQVVAFVQANT